MQNVQREVSDRVVPVVLLALLLGLAGCGSSSTPVATAPPLASLSPLSVAFLNDDLGQTSVPQTIYVTNIGGSPLSVSSIAVAGDFAETDTCGTALLPQAFCTVAVTFAGTTSGPRTGSLTISDNSVGSPHTITLTGNTGTINRIQHTIFIIKEGRSFDHYFGTYVGAQGAIQGLTSYGALVPLAQAADQAPYVLGDGFADTVNAIDNGRMDRFDLIANGNLNGDLLPFTQFQQADIPNYWSLAQTYSLGDHMFSALSGPSFPNHLYTIAADSVGITDNPVNTNPTDLTLPRWGCDADPASTVRSEDTLGNVTSIFPCVDSNTIVDSLQTAGVSWKYYAPPQGTSGYQWNALNAIKHIRYAADGVTDGPLWLSNVAPDTQFEADALAGNLPSVSYVVVPEADSESALASVCAGENRTVAQVNAVMNGPNWNDSAIFIVWANHGGYYDDFGPSFKDIYGLGARVPLLVVSPYALQGVITPTPFELSSLPAFLEKRYLLKSLTTRDKKAHDMEDAFDFTQPTRLPQPLQPRACPAAPTTAKHGGAAF